MNIIFIFLAVLAAIVSWWLSQQRITAKPWLETGPMGDTGASSIPAAKIGLGLFLAGAVADRSDRIRQGSRFFDLLHSLTESLYPPLLKMHHRRHQRNK